MNNKILLLSFLLLASATVQLYAQCGTMFEYPNDAVKCTNKDYYYYAPSGYPPYNWYINNGTKSGGGTTSDYWVSVKWDQPGSSRMVSVNYASGSCNSSFYVTNMPGAPVISGPANACPGSTSTFTVPAGTACTWTIPSGSNMINSSTVSGSGNNTLQITWKQNLSGYAQIVVERDQTAGSNCKTKGFYYVSVESNVGTISGTTAVNSGITYSYSVSGTNPSWTATGGVLIDPQGSNPMRVKWNCNISAGNLSVNYTSSVGCTKSASLNTTISPVLPSLTPTDSYPANEYCYKASRVFATELGYSNYVWTISGQLEGYNNIITSVYTKNGTNSNTFNTKTMPDGTTSNFYGTVTIKVKYDMGGGCFSAEKSQVMNVTPATISFRGSTTAVPIVCYSDSQNIGSYSTDAGFSNYAWSTPTVTNVGQGTATASAQSTNMNWTTAGSGIGGLIPITVTYLKSALNCTNTNLARNGVNIRNPSLSGASPVSVGQISYYSTSSDGYEYAWNISPTVSPIYGRFTDQFGTTIPAPSGSANYITWDRNNEPDPFPTVSVNYWIYYPQVGGTRISYCTGATKVVDIRGCTTCTNRIAADSPSVNNTDDAIEPSALGAYPTPADNELWVRNVPVGANIKMISMSGAEAINTTQDQESLVKKLETGNINSGVYLLRTTDVDNQPVTLRVIIKH